MELEELKSTWEKLSEKLDRQQYLNAKIIEQMTNQQYRNRLNNIARPESIASLVCFAAAIVLICNFATLDTLLLQVFGVLSLLFLIVLPVISLKSIRGLQHINISLATYTATLKIFAEKKIRFQKFQQLNVWLSFVFMIVSMPVSIKLLTGKDISQNIYTWLLVIPISAIVLLFLSRWVLKHYDNTLKKAGELLSEIES